MKNLPWLLVLAAACGDDSSPEPATPEPRPISELQEEMARFRGIEAGEPAVVLTVTPEQIEEYVTAMMRVRLPIPRLVALGILQYCSFGSTLAVPDAEGWARVLQGQTPSDAWEREFLQAAGATGMQLLAYYDFESDALCLREERDLAFQDYVVSHEIVHLLQDRRFDLSFMLGPQRSIDRMGACASLVEGDATYAGALFMLGPGGVSDAQRAAWLRPYLSGSPLGISYQYELGARFCAALHDRGGWVAVDAAFDAPPESMEQVLHPAFYVEGDRPVEIGFPDEWTLPFADPWRLVHEDTIGEAVHAQLWGGVDGPTRVRGAVGWDGDRLRLYATPDGRWALILASVWDREEDAVEAETAWRAAIQTDVDVARDGVVVVTAAGDAEVRAAAVASPGLAVLTRHPDDPGSAASIEAEQQAMLDALDSLNFVVDGNRFTSMEHGFSLESPGPDWRIVPEPQAMIPVMVVHPSGDNVNVSVTPAAPMPLHDILEAEYAAMSRQVRMTRVSSRATSLGGEPAQEEVLEWAPQGVVMRMRQVAALRDGRLFVLTFTDRSGDHDHETEMRAIESSFAFE